MTIPGLRLVEERRGHRVFSLPDGVHFVDIYEGGTYVHCYVRNARYDTRESVTFQYAKVPHWRDCVEQFKELAVRKYPKNIMKRGELVQRFMNR